MSDAHQILGIERVCRDFRSLHDVVVRNWGRIEITCDEDGEGGGTVLLSKAELEHMERALEILCELPGGKSICEELTRLADRTTTRAMSALINPMNTPAAAGNSGMQSGGATA